MGSYNDYYGNDKNIAADRKKSKELNIFTIILVIVLIIILALVYHDINH